ncbi:hypothetical protein HQ42_05330 [Porphyromonas gulae]|nr:hypothetical protein HQ42_05330 [Porphyromonas gulae]
MQIGIDLKKEKLPLSELFREAASCGFISISIANGFSGFSEDLELSVRKSRANRINRQRKKYVVQQVCPYHMSKAVEERPKGFSVIA